MNPQMSSAGYVPDRLYARLFQPWTLPESEWPLCKEDWSRVDAICALPWKGRILDFGAGDGTLAAMVLGRNPAVEFVACVEQDIDQRIVIEGRWSKNRWPMSGFLAVPKPEAQFDGALCCEVLEHLTPEEGHKVLCAIKAVMKPGGMLCVTVPHKNKSRAAFPGHIRPFDHASLLWTVRTAGFNVFDEAWSDSGIVRPGLPWLWAVARA